MSSIIFSFINSEYGLISHSFISSKDLCDSTSKYLIESIVSPQNSILIGLSLFEENTSKIYPLFDTSPVLFTIVSLTYPIDKSFLNNSSLLTSVSFFKIILLSIHNFLLGKYLKNPIRFVITILWSFSLSSFNVFTLIDFNSGDIASDSLVKKSSIGNKYTLLFNFDIDE